MKTLIVEDDRTSMILLKEILKPYGPIFFANDGQEALEAVHEALKKNDPYDLICMDIMMPGMDGQTALRKIRELEESQGIYSSDGSKIVMVTTLGNMDNLSRAFGNLCDAYLVKPIGKKKLLDELIRLDLIK